MKLLQLELSLHCFDESTTGVKSATVIVVTWTIYYSPTDSPEVYHTLLSNNNQVQVENKNGDGNYSLSWDSKSIQEAVASFVEKAFSCGLNMIWKAGFAENVTALITPSYVA